MIEEYTKQINKLLERINEENKENINELINYSTSTELCVGGALCRYGEIYKLIFYSTDYEEVIHKLEKLYELDKYVGYEEDITKIQDIFIKGIREGKKFELGVKEEVLFMLEHEYIFDTILKCL
jgi:hypothetical protein